MYSTEASVQAQSRYDCSILSIRPYKLTAAITGARHRNSTAGAMPEPRKNQKFGFLRWLERTPKQLGQKHKSWLWNNRALPKQILMVGFNVISAHLSSMKWNWQPKGYFGKKALHWNKLWPKWPSCLKHTTEQRKGESSNGFATGPYFSQLQHQGASLAMATSLGYSRKHLSTWAGPVLVSKLLCS